MIATWGVGLNPTRLFRPMSGIVALCLLLLGWPGLLQASCRTFFQQKKFQQAASCFIKQARNLSNTGGSRYRKARLLRNAATCFELAAKRKSKVENRSYLLEQAIIWLQYHNQKRLYEDQEARRQTLRRIRQIKRRIGYVRLVVISNHPRAKVCIKGYQWNRCEIRTVWTQLLRPGAYKIQVTYLMNPVVDSSKDLKLQRNEQKTVLFTPPYESVSIVTNDPKAKMTLQGEGLDKALSQVGSLWSLQLPPGRYKLKVKYPHRPAKQRSFQVKSGQPVAQLFQRPPEIPLLRVDSLPQRADVFIGSKRRGKTSLSLPLEQGSYNIRIQKPCFVPISRNVQTKPNKVNNLSLVLKRDPVYLEWKQRKNMERTYKVLSWSVVGLGAAALITSGILHITASSHQTAALDALQKDPVAGFNEFRQLGLLGNGLRTGGYVSLALGATAVGLGLTGVFLSSPGPRNKIPCTVRYPVPSVKTKTIPPKSPSSPPVARSQRR